MKKIAGMAVVDVESAVVGDYCVKFPFSRVGLWVSIDTLQNLRMKRKFLVVWFGVIFLIRNTVVGAVSFIVLFSEEGNFCF